MSDPNLRPTMSMIWTFLLFTVHQHAETSPAVNRAGASMEPVGKTWTHAQVAEQMAREQFPSGMVDGTGWQFYSNGRPKPFWDVFQSPYDNDGEDRDDAIIFSDVCETVLGPLSPTDPAHVAMVARALALSFSMPCGVEPTGLRVIEDVDSETNEPGILVAVVSLVRPLPPGVPVQSGQFFPGASLAEGVGVLLFRWFLERHAEIEAALTPATSPA